MLRHVICLFVVAWVRFAITQQATTILFGDPSSFVVTQDWGFVSVGPSTNLLVTFELTSSNKEIEVLSNRGSLPTPSDEIYDLRVISTPPILIKSDACLKEDDFGDVFFAIRCTSSCSETVEILASRDDTPNIKDNFKIGFANSAEETISWSSLGIGVVKQLFFESDDSNFDPTSKVITVNTEIGTDDGLRVLLNDNEDTCPGHTYPELGSLPEAAFRPTAGSYWLGLTEQQNGGDFSGDFKVAMKVRDLQCEKTSSSVCKFDISYSAVSDEAVFDWQKNQWQTELGRGRMVQELSTLNEYYSADCRKALKAFNCAYVYEQCPNAGETYLVCPEGCDNVLEFCINNEDKPIRPEEEDLFAVFLTLECANPGVTECTAIADQELDKDDNTVLIAVIVCLVVVACLVITLAFFFIRRKRALRVYTIEENQQSAKMNMNMPTRKQLTITQAGTSQLEDPMKNRVSDGPTSNQLQDEAVQNEQQRYTQQRAPTEFSY